MANCQTGAAMGLPCFSRACVALILKSVVWRWCGFARVGGGVARVTGLAGATREGGSEERLALLEAKAGGSCRAGSSQGDGSGGPGWDGVTVPGVLTGTEACW